jgi:hypothetical protein
MVAVVVLLQVIFVYVVMEWLFERIGLGYVSRDKSITQVQSILESLGREHPELLELEKLRQLVQDEKDAASGRQSFWLGVAVNFAFLVLGFVISYVLTHYHLLPQ